MPRRFEQHYKFSLSDDLSAARLNRILADLDARVAGNEDVKSAVEAAIDGLNKVALDRLNSVLTPAIEQIQEVATLGFLKATSSVERTLGMGDYITFVVDEGAQRELFTPTHFVAVTRTATAEVKAILRVVSYDAQHGELYGEIVALYGDAGPFADWEIAASAGAVAAQLQMLDDAEAARDATIAAKDAAEAAAGTATAKADEAAADRAAAVGAAGTATTKADEASASADAAATFAASIDPETLQGTIEAAKRSAIAYTLAFGR